MELQHTLRSIIRGMPRIFFGGVPAERAGDERLAHRRLGIRGSAGLGLTSEAFAEGAPIPREFSADGDGRAPPLRWSGALGATRALALVVEDPDAPTPNPFVHWLLYGMRVSTHTSVEALAAGAKIGRNSTMRPGWAGCAPPKGDLPHRYCFQLFALDRELRLGPQAGRSALLDGMRGHALGCAILTGTYRR